MQILSLRKIHLLLLMKNSHTFIFHTGSCQERCPSQICVGSFQFPQCPSTQTHLQKNYFSKISPSLPSHISNLFFSPLPSPSSFCLSRTKHLPTPENSLPFSPFFFSFKISLCGTIQNIFLAPQVLQQATQSKGCGWKQSKTMSIIGLSTLLTQSTPLHVLLRSPRSHLAILPYHTTLYIGIKNL